MEPDEAAGQNTSQHNEALGEAEAPRGKGAVVITGATGGIGLATAIGVATSGYLVVLHGRSGERCDVAAEGVREAVPEANVHSVVADLASLDAVRRVGTELVIYCPDCVSPELSEIYS